MERSDEMDELKHLAPTLHGLKRTDPFTVPDGFFERFPHQVQAAIVERKRSSAPAWTWWMRAAIALPVVALAVTGLWMLRTQQPDATAQPVAVTPLTDRELDALDDAEVLAAFDLSRTNELTDEDLGAVDLQLNEDELLAYLENEDITDLIVELE